MYLYCREHTIYQRLVPKHCPTQAPWPSWNGMQRNWNWKPLNQFLKRMKWNTLFTTFHPWELVDINTCDTKLDLCIHLACWPFSTMCEFPSAVTGASLSLDVFGYFSHFLVCSSLVSLNIFRTDSSAWPTKDLPHASLLPFVSFTASSVHGVNCGNFLLHSSILWPVPLSVSFALLGDLAWFNHILVSMGVSLVIPGMTLIDSFCTLSSFRKFVWDIGQAKSIIITDNFWIALFLTNELTAIYTFTHHLMMIWWCTLVYRSHSVG